MSCTCLYKFTHTVKSLISSTHLIQMRFWRSSHFKGRHRRANLTWSVCLVLRGFLFEVAGQLELSDFCHFDLFYFSTEMYTSILPTDARVEQVSLNGESENIAWCCALMSADWFVFNRKWRQGPFPGAARCACWYWVEQTLSLGCPVGRPASGQGRKWKSHVRNPAQGSSELKPAPASLLAPELN